ncbi:hypothetical protein, partial [Salmonella sp. s39606]|uniref:hypothetical protein n=1 Tax=Salmonella sp. s39606 TaxID=3159643 RepID=UPI003980A8CB
MDRLHPFTRFFFFYLLRCGFARIFTGFLAMINDCYFLVFPRQVLKEGWFFNGFWLPTNIIRVGWGAGVFQLQSMQQC